MMTKTFHEILAEKEDEFIYRIHSTADIHDPELCAKIHLSLLPYKIKSMDCETYKPLRKNNEMFPDEPNSPTYTIKVITGHPLTKGFLMTLAMDAHIHQSHLKIEPDKAEDPDTQVEVSKDDAQSLVGTKRIGSFIKELKKERDKRDEMTVKREVYENFYTTHRGLEVVLKKPFMKGYYLVEAYKEDGKKYFNAEGPFEVRPEGNLYIDRFNAGTPKIVSETNNGGLCGVKVLVE